MRKIISIISFVVCLFVPSLVFCLATAVDITGPQELSSLKTGIEKSITTRCIAKGIALEKYQKLTVTISKLGDVISYDALLDTKPERAFHKDLKDISALSATIDEMIAALFTEASKPQAAPVPPAKTTIGQESALKVELPFVATSIASLGDKIFVSDKKTVYELKGEKTSPLWKAPGSNEILRIYPYGDSIIVLTKIINNCRSFRIQGTEMKERWDNAVIPLGSGLISTSLKFLDRNFGIISYAWSQPKQVSGTSPQLPEKLDILSATSVEVKTRPSGYEVFSYNSKNNLTVTDGKSIVWTDDTIAGITPQFIEDVFVDREEQSEPPARFYLKPRIISLGDKTVTFRNSQGLAKIVSGLNMFEFSQVLLYTPSANDFAKEELATFPNSYCPDIAVVQGKIAVLVVKDNGTFVQFLGL
jgi:hypothetical protein